MSVECRSPNRKRLQPFDPVTSDGVDEWPCSDSSGSCDEPEEHGEEWRQKIRWTDCVGTSRKWGMWTTEREWKNTAEVWDIWRLWFSQTNHGTEWGTLRFYLNTWRLFNFSISETTSTWLLANVEAVISMCLFEGGQ